MPPRRTLRERATRRLVVGAGLSLAAAPALAAPEPAPDLAEVERRSRGRLGVFATDLASGRRLAWRADERFPMCSTFKLALAAAVLARVDAGRESLDRAVPVSAADIVAGAAPRIAAWAGKTATVDELCAAAVVYSDNTSANQLLASLGGPGGLTRWLRAIGDRVTRLDRTEPTLNEAAPGDLRDTTTPRAMVATMRKLLAGKVLSAASRDRLAGWLAASPLGAARLPAGLPAGWRVGHKTGTGERGSTNDLAIVYPPAGGAILVAAYLTASEADLAVRERALAEVGALVAARMERA